MSKYKGVCKMRRLKIAGLAFLAVLALGLITVEAALAASTVLPEFSTEVVGGATSGTSTLNVEGTKISCPSGTTLTSPTSKKLGTFRILFSGCLSGGEPCHSLGQVLGSLTIEVTGEYHLVSRASNRTFYEIWFLLASTDSTAALHIECEAAAVGLVSVWGNVLGQIKATPASSERTFIIILKAEGGGKTIKQELSTYGNDNGTEVTVEGLKGKLGSGTVRVVGMEVEWLIFVIGATSLLES
jgi:hypothetical protein